MRSPFSEAAESLHAGNDPPGSPELSDALGLPGTDQPAVPGGLPRVAVAVPMPPEFADIIAPRCSCPSRRPSVIAEASAIPLCGSSWREPRNPARHISPKALVLPAECLLQRRFFVHHYEDMEKKPE